MNDTRTPLQQLLTANLELDHHAVLKASDDLLRSAVIQAIDALERLSDVGDLFAVLGEEWGMPKATSSHFDSLLEDRRATDPIEGGFKDNGYTMALPSGSIIISEASRADLITGLGSLHTSIRRYEKATQMMLESASAACRGDLVQSEFDKAEVRDELENDAPASRPSTPRP